VTLRSGMDTRHGTQVFSFLLMRRVSGLLINGCSKSEEEIKGEQQLNRGKKNTGKRDKPEEEVAFWLSLTQCELARGSDVDLGGLVCNV